jgi:sec-independent protein translocase protein TatA
MEFDSKGRCIMGEFSPFHWLVVLAIVVLLFGGKKIPEVMRGLGEGIRSFKEGMHGAGQGPAQTTQVSPPTVTTSAPATEEKK